MLLQTQLGNTNFAQKRNLVTLIKSGEITLGGYIKTKIYGTLNCKSGKRMKVENRIFFADEQDAINAGYRPCGHCMPHAYKIWKAK
jgi:DNA/RNA endonuclease YhcR with UshA esterase domain